MTTVTSFDKAGISPISPKKEIGMTGLVHYNGSLDEEFLKVLKWPNSMKIYREMSDNDPIVGAMLFAVEMLIRNVNWSVKPASESPEDVETADFVQSCLHDMEKPWSEVINDVLSFLPYGFSVHELVFKRRFGPVDDRRFFSKHDDGRWGWRKMPIRAQDTITGWKFSESGDLEGVTQQVPTGITSVTIPVNKFLLFRVNSKKDNPESKSVLRNAYRPWYFKKTIEEIEAIGIERDLAGLPIAIMPSEYMLIDANADQKALYEQMKQLVTNVKANQQAGIVLPSDTDEHGQRLFDFKLINSGDGKGKHFDTQTVVQRYNSNIAQSILADFILLGQQSVGSFALSDSKTNVFSVAIGAWLKTISDVFNNKAIPQLLKMNNIPFSSLPSLVYGDIESQDLDKLSNYFSRLAREGLIVADARLEDHLRVTVDAPIRTDETPPPGLPDPAPAKEVTNE